MKTHNSKLKMRREQLGLTQKLVAEESGIGVRTYQRYEAGTRHPNTVIAAAISKTLSAPIEVLFPLISD